MKQKKQHNSPGFNWGKGLAIAIILFITATLGMVGFIISLDYHLVSDDHYERAEHYQDHIQRVEQTGSLDQPVEIRVNDGRELQIVFPFSGQENIEGSVELYRPNDAGLDRKFPLSPDENFTQRISAEGLARGRWHVKVNWTLDGKQYYNQENIFL
ncbi:MAG: FixH family protein [Balneolaceae bacterium]